MKKGKTLGHPGWMYVDGMNPAAIGKAHGMSVDEVLDWAERIGVPEYLLRRKGLGNGGKSREDLKQDAKLELAA